MKGIVIGVVGLLSMTLSCGPAAAWAHSGRWGSASGGGGSWSASGYRGGSASGGGGSWSGTGFRGGSASGGGGSWSASSPYYDTTAYHSPYYGTTAYHSYYGGAYYPSYYHPPTTVNYYGSGCYDCGGWSTAGAAAAGAMVGMAAGATIASANTSAATSSAYASGYAAGSANTATYPVGSIVATLPPGCTNPTVNGMYYDLCGTTWFQPSYGANGVYYRVVPTP